MTPELHQETEKLTRSWMRHSADALRDYLIAEVEDPRINMQSILTRHFVVRAAFPGLFEELMHEEYRFAAVVAALGRLLEQLHHPEETELVLYALGRGSDNAEGLAIPPPIVRAFGQFPRDVGGIAIPNYIEAYLKHVQFEQAKAKPAEAAVDIFPGLWQAALAGPGAPAPSRRLTVIEPACGSANDYRFFPRYGLSQLVDYTGFDLCPANVANARAQFPGQKFEHGNVFEIQGADRAFQLCFVHDLFEHLSIGGLATAVGEICRVTNEAICAHFFNMDETPEHRVQPVEDYHWNTLSLRRVLDLFQSHGFHGHTVHIGTFLQRLFEGEPTHNPNAYTIYFKRAN